MSSLERYLQLSRRYLSVISYKTDAWYTPRFGWIKMVLCPQGICRDGAIPRASTWYNTPELYGAVRPDRAPSREMKKPW